MLDRTIPFYNTILRCDSYHHRDIFLPRGFSIVPYKSGYEKAWAKLEYSIGDFDSVYEAEHYFVTSYLQNSELTDRILFTVDEEDKVVGSCIAWTDKRMDSIVSSLHWLVVDEKYHGIGLGRALCCAVMNYYEEHGSFPVYIHTQPWSWKAILLYISMDFRLQKTDTFSHYVNDYGKAMEELKKTVTEERFELLKKLSDE